MFPEHTVEVLGSMNEFVDLTIKLNTSDAVRWDSETDLGDKTPLAYKNNQSTQIHRAGFPETFSMPMRNCVARKACLRSLCVCPDSLGTA